MVDITRKGRENKFAPMDFSTGAFVFVMLFCIVFLPPLLPHGWKRPLHLLPVFGSCPGNAASEAGHQTAAEGSVLAGSYAANHVSGCPRKTQSSTHRKCRSSGSRIPFAHTTMLPSYIVANPCNAR